jgi:PAS domain S-box-containing protein
MSPARWRNPVVKQWGLMLAALCLAVVACSLGGLFWRLDMSLYDAALPTGTAPTDVVIVAIDDASIAELGRWPWRRALHAALLDRLRAMGARAVALDLLLTEPDTEYPEGDAALAAAMKAGPPTVLPLLVEMPGPGRPLRERLPILPLAQASAGIGHAHLELDRDGVVRSVFLAEGIGAPHWLHFAAVLLDSIPGASPVALRGARHPDLPGAPPVWVRDHQIMVPFLGRPGSFPQVSYVDVLRGTVDDSAIRGKLVLVGATAQGVGDAYTTPKSGEGRAMAGVEITANVLQALRNGSEIRPVGAWTAASIGVIVVVLSALCLLLLAPWQSLLAVTGVGLATAAGSVMALRHGGWWWPPTASLAAIAVIYPLWSWRRLAVTQAFLENEFKLLANERFPLLSGLPTPASTSAPVDFVEQRIDLLRTATERLRGVRRLFAETIGSLPDATILADETGRIVLANHAAAALFGASDPRDLENTSVDSQLHARVQTDVSRFASLSALAPCTVEAALAESSRHVLIRAVPFRVRAGERIGTILALADITELRAAQSERDDVLRFLSHDMKSPASSLLGLAQLQRDPGRALPPRELSARLELLAQRLLTLVDGFVALARAGSTDPRAFDTFDVCDAIRDAYDEVWASARAHNNSINAVLSEEPIMVHGDRQMLARAVVNLLSNALKFSGSGAEIDLGCRQSGDEVIIKVADHGPGIAPDSASMLFQRFSRGLHRGESDPGGAGLGLAFVRVVAEKHRGRAWVDVGEGYGAIFCLSLPAAPHSAS